MGRRNKDRRMKYFKEITTILFLAFILMLMVKDGQAQRTGVNKPRVNKSKKRFRKRTIKRRVRRAPVRRSIVKPKPKPKKESGQGQIKRQRTCGKKCQMDKLHYLWTASRHDGEVYADAGAALLVLWLNIPALF